MGRNWKLRDYCNKGVGSSLGRGLWRLEVVVFGFELKEVVGGWVCGDLCCWIVVSCFGRCMYWGC